MHLLNEVLSLEALVFQGLNYIGALIYLILNDETSATRLMIHAVGERRNYYTPEMSGIVTDVRVLTDLLRLDRKNVSCF
ncbi:unnamed protein product [Gongylonema pulchrum]|uniref:Uncharacterized protein n=1 Tax=Gongylonema pulchrum TaxID=637853 RepID=A0A183EW08_9BILA|nr:unnamed protein product [Gongylonema pulchrum]